MSDVTIYSATKLSKEVEKELTAFAGKTFPSSKVVFELDKDLIAGIKIVGADKQIELSLNDLLETLGRSLS